MSNQQSSYSRLVEYDLHSNSVLKIIFEVQGGIGRIREFDISSESIVFSVTSSEDQIIYEKVYYYDVKKGGAPVLFRSRIEPGGYYPTHLCLDRGKVGWIEHDFETSLSSILVYDI